MELPEELLRVTARIMQFRNALSHFGFSEDENEYEVISWQELRDQLGDFYRTLREIMEDQGVIFEKTDI